MDWNECIKKRIIKEIKEDKNRIKSIKKIAESKIKSADILPKEMYYSKISLLYDAMRELLECLALENNYKIYNHECYTPFLKEILKRSNEADLFDKLRIIRNGINYYGREMNLSEAEEIIKNLKELIKKFI